MNINDELITVSDVANAIPVSTGLPENKCITRGEFDDLMASIITYTLIVNPTPSDATVRIDGVETKTAKVSANTILTVEVSKPGYITSTQQVQVTQDQTLNVVLESVKYTLIVNTTPSNAIVRIDGVETKTAKVSANTYVMVEVTKPGFEKNGRYIQVTQDQTLNIVLEPSSSGGVYRPINAPEGVYILSTEGYLYERFYWETSNNSNAVGVAVKTSACSFVIAPKERNSIPWSHNTAIISDCAIKASQSSAQTDYNGNANTIAIVAQLGIPSRNQMYAAYYCSLYSFKNGVKGYLGSAGEWYQAYQNKSEIDACMSLIGGDALYDPSNSYVQWSSTQYSSNNAWAIEWGNGHLTYYSKLSNYSEIRIRPFSAFPA